MPRRPYRQARRAEMLQETRERIVRATVALHAKQGALQTTHAMIADEAGVSPQTVYNHFPDRGAVINACTAHVAAEAPKVDRDSFAPARTPAERIARLADAVYARHDFMAPWLRLGWHEAAAIPELAAILARAEAEIRALIVEAMTIRHERPDPDFIDLATALLAYPTWRHLTGARTSAAAGRLVARTLALLMSRNLRAKERKS